MLPKRIIAVGVGAVVVAGGVTVGGVAAADSATSSTHSTSAKGSTTTSTTASSTASTRHHRRHPLARRALHGEFVVRGKGGKDVTVDMVRGKVTAVSPTSITVAARDGYSATYAVTSKTRVHVRGQKGKRSISVVKTGDRAGVFATKAGTALDARAVVDRGQK
jgi:siroheme synthase